MYHGRIAARRCSHFVYPLCTCQVASVGCACLACVCPLGPCPWDTERVSQRVRYVNPLAKLFFSPAAYYEIATLSLCHQISPYSNINPRHPSTRTTAEQISTVRKRSQKSLRQAQRAEAQREKLQYRREQRKQARHTHTPAHTPAPAHAPAHTHTHTRAHARGRAHTGTAAHTGAGTQAGVGAGRHTACRCNAVYVHNI